MDMILSFAVMVLLFMDPGYGALVACNQVFGRGF